jgi:hypothetical protein
MARRSAGHPGDTGTVLEKFLRPIFREESRFQLGGPFVRCRYSPGGHDTEVSVRPRIHPPQARHCPVLSFFAKDPGNPFSFFQKNKLDRPDEPGDDGWLMSI